MNLHIHNFRINDFFVKVNDIPEDLIKKSKPKAGYYLPGTKGRFSKKGKYIR